MNKNHFFAKQCWIIILIFFSNSLMNARDGYPKFSPDGKRVVFHSDRNSDNFDIYVVNIDGTGLKQITDFAGNDVNPSWSADGLKIYYASGEGMQNWEIYSIDLNGKNKTRLTFVDGREMHIAASPDGEKIAFISDRKGVFELYTMNVDGSNQQKVINQENKTFRKFHPSWSHNGKKLLFDGGETEGPINIFIMNADGSGLKQLTDTNIRNAHACFINGKNEVVFSHFFENNIREINTININNKKQKKFELKNVIKPGSPDISFDGKNMVFVGEDKNGNQNIYFTNLSTSETKQITFD